MTQNQQTEREIKREGEREREEVYEDGEVQAQFKLNQRDECSVNRKKERGEMWLERQDKEKARVFAAVSVIV